MQVFQAIERLVHFLVKHRIKVELLYLNLHFLVFHLAYRQIIKALTNQLILMLRVSFLILEFFLDQKRFPTTQKGKHNSPTKNVVMISIKKFDKIKIYHKVTEHKKDIL